jgi:signal transduction histidine kinase
VTSLDGRRRLLRASNPLSAGAERAPGRALAAGLVYGVLICWVSTIYLGVLVADGLSSTNTHLDWWAHIIAITLIAVTVEPVRRWLRSAVDDIVYGYPDAAYDVMTRLNRQIDTVEPSIAQTIARTLNVPYVSIVDGDAEVDVVGRRPSDRDLADIPLAYQGEVIGHLWVASRHSGTPLSNRDMSLLADLAHQLGVGVYAVRASQQVQASRAALVTAREEERRRIRRDLHDGLGPTLASIKLQLTAVQRLLEADPERASAMLDEVRGDMDRTTADIRRLVYGLRPPLIDEFGLIAALRNQPAAHAGIDVDVRPAELPDLPAAVEVALYRIASESIHNAVRHSGGRRCEVSIVLATDTVRMTVGDDGRGLPEPLIEGVGMAAMRERAAELGGTVTMATNDRGGTTVTTVVPLGPWTTP